MAERIQLRRVKGWRKPEGTIVVARPTKWGNPFTPAGARDAGYEGTDDELRAMCAQAFRQWLRGDFVWQFANGAARRERILADLAELRGHDLACWCPPGDPCHGDVLLELANG